MAADPTLDLFAVLEANNEFVSGSSGLPPTLALQTPPVRLGSSFFSRAGQPLLPAPVNWAIELQFAGLESPPLGEE